MSAHTFVPAETRTSNAPHPAADARRRVARVLDGLDGHTWQARADAELVVSELVSNALRHGGGVSAVRVGLTADRTGLWLEVEDDDRRRAEARRLLGEEPTRAGGFGWPIVLRLAVSVTVADTPSGKCIRVVLPVA